MFFPQSATIYRSTAPGSRKAQNGTCLGCVTVCFGLFEHSDILEYHRRRVNGIFPEEVVTAADNLGASLKIVRTPLLRLTCFAVFAE